MESQTTEITQLNFRSGSEVLVGYASENLNKTDDKFFGKPVAFQTSELQVEPGAAAKYLNPTLDMFLMYPDCAVDNAGHNVKVEDVSGMSGCAIWEMREPSEGKIWNPHDAIRLVGIQSAAVIGKYLRAKRWSYIEQVINASPDS